MKCPGLNINIGPVDCGNPQPTLITVYYDPETGRVYDDHDNFIGYGTIKDGILEITQEFGG